MKRTAPSSRCDQRSRLPVARRASRPPSHDGKVHVEHAHHPLREQHEPPHRAHQEPMPAHARRRAGPSRDAYRPRPRRKERAHTGDTRRGGGRDRQGREWEHAQGHPRFRGAEDAVVCPCRLHISFERLSRQLVGPFVDQT